MSTGETEHFHADLLGSTVLTTNSAGLLEQSFAYTAFGEPVAADPADTTRYGYAGSHGYESGLLTLACPDPTLPDVTLQHVGHRWYEPATGRFVQRDPIGITGGLNVYLYCSANPLAAVDPYGHLSEIPETIQNIGGVISGLGGLVWLVPTPQTKAAGAAITVVGCIVWGTGSGAALVRDHGSVVAEGIMDADERRQEHEQNGQIPRGPGNCPWM
ncbi:MAG: RHS repeat-associated core domain-containing protein [Planctomycetes bacterium]|nr:RHS repeat-associated core domain-containing protein [Planctomycetota bacterium]